MKSYVNLITAAATFSLMTAAFVVGAEFRQNYPDVDCVVSNTSSPVNCTVDLFGTIRILAEPAAVDNSNCRFFLPRYKSSGTGQLNPGDEVEPLTYRDGDWHAEWYGLDTDRDCGLQVQNVQRKDNTDPVTPAQWAFETKYYDEGYTFDLYVIMPPTAFEWDKSQMPGGIREVNLDPDSPIEDLLVNFTCEVTNVWPEPTFEYRISNGGYLNLDYQHLIEPEMDVNNAGGGFDYHGIFMYIPHPSHDGEYLECEYGHMTLTDEQIQSGFNVDRIKLIVLAPVSLDADNVYCPICNEPTYIEDGDTVTIPVTFKANPELDVATWILPGNVNLSSGINETTREAYDRYSADHEVVNNTYTITLTIRDWEYEDYDKTFSLYVENAYGNDTLHVRIQEPPPNEDTGLSAGAIAGIVCGCVVGVILIAVLAFFFVDRNKKKKEEKARKKRQAELKAAAKAQDRAMQQRAAMSETSSESASSRSGSFRETAFDHYQSQPQYHHHDAVSHTSSSSVSSHSS